MGTRKPKTAHPDEMKDRTVYVKPRESGPGVDIMWREGAAVRRVYRKSAAMGAQFAIEQQKRLDQGGAAESTIPCGDGVAGMDGGSSGAPARELLWQMMVACAMNPGPGPKGLQAAARTVALLGGALRKFMTADLLGSALEDADDVMDGSFWAIAAPHCKAWMEAAGVPEEKKAVVLEVLAGGKAA